MNYQDFRFEDFITDPYFIRWIKHPDLESDHFWQSWIKNHPDQAGEVFKAREILQQLEFRIPVPAEKDRQDVLDRLLARKYRINRKKSALRDHWYRYAAVFLFLVFSAAYLYHRSNQAPVSELPVITRIQETKENPKGLKSRFYLPDGTLVHLNADSRLLFSNPFEDSVREVQLFGEAYFEVVADPVRPFIVQTGDVYTEALGTAFNIQNFGEGVARISLTEGKVKVWQKKKEVTLDPGYQVIFQENQPDYSLFTFDPERELAWTNGDIYFENASFNEVISTLERWYGVEMVCSNIPEQKWTYNGVFRNNSSLERVLDRLGFSKNFNYQIEGKTVIIKFNQ